MLTRARRRPKKQKLDVEPLEPRILLSADVAPFAVAMSADQNDLTLSYDADTDLLQIHENLTGALVAEQHRAETSSVVVSGHEGDDRLVMDLAGSYIFPGGVMFDGAGGDDELVGPDFESTWIVDGVDRGSLNGHDFRNVESLTGGADNEDLFRLLAEGQSSGGLEGGAGGFDSIEVHADGGTVVFGASGPDSGTITVNGRLTEYAGFEPVTAFDATSITVDLGAILPGDVSRSDLTLSYDSSTGGSKGGAGATDIFELDAASIETHVLEIDASTTDVAILLGDGNDEIDISGVSGSHLSGILTVDGEGGDDTFVLGQDFGDLVIDAGASGTDAVEVTASGPTAVVGSQIQSTTSGTATLQNDFESITGDNIELDLAALQSAADQAFGQFGAIFEALQSVGDFISDLPLISGSNVEGIVDVTLAKIAAFEESFADVRFALNAEFDALEAAANSTIADVRSAIDGIDKTVEHLGPGVISAAQDVADNVGEEISDALLGALDLSTLGFSFKLTVTPDVGADRVADVTATLQAVQAASGADNVEKLAAALNDAIATTDLLGEVVAVARDGRVGFQVSGVDASALMVQGLSFGGENLADSVLGYPNAIADALKITDVKERLTSLGANAFGFDNVDLSLVDETTYTFSFDLQTARTNEFGYDFGAGADEQGLAFDAAAKLETLVAALLEADLTLDLGTLGDFTDDSFTADIGELGAGFEIAMTGLTAAANFGFLSAEATGDVTMDAGVQAATPLAFDSASDTVGTFVGGIPFQVVGFDSSTTTFQGVGDDEANVNLTFTADAGLVAGNLTLGTAITDVFSSPDPSLSFGGGVNVAEFANFSNLTPAGVLQTLGDFVSWFEDLADSSLASGIDIPLVQGGLDGVLNLARIVADAFLYDIGADGERDGDTRLITDVNNALAGAGLDQFVRATPTAAGFELEVLDENITDVTIAAGTGDTSFGELGIGGTWNSGDPSFLQTGGLALTGVLSGQLVAAVTINFQSGKSVNREFSISADALADNVAIGDDVAKLLDAFNAPTFNSATELAGVLAKTGILTDGFDPSNLAGSGLAYDEASDQLTYAIEIGSTTPEPLFDVELPTDFSLDLSPILDVSSSTRLVLSGEGTLQFVIGWDLSSDGVLPGPATLLDPTTTLADLGIADKVKTFPAITAEADANVVRGVLTSDASFTVILDEGLGSEISDVVTVEAFNTFDNTTVQNLVDDINLAIGGTALAGKLSAQTAGSNNDFLELVTTETTIRVTVEAGNPALKAFGFQPDTAVDGTTLTAALPVPEFLGVLTSDASFTLLIDGTSYTVTVPKATTISIDDGADDTLGTDDDQLLTINRNIFDLMADVRNALKVAKDAADATVDLSDQVDVGFQSRRLVLTSLGDVPMTIGETSAGSAAELGFTDLSTPQAANDDDIIVRLDDASTIAVALDGVTDIAGVIAAFAAADSNLILEIAPDDPATPEDEGGKRLRVTYDTGGVKLVSVEGTNGSGIGAALGILGLDQSPFDPGSLADGIVTGSPISGITLADRFFLTDDNPGDGENKLGEIATFGFDVQAGRLVNDIGVVEGDDLIAAVSKTGIAGSIDLRGFVGETIEIKGVNGFTATSYTISEVVEVDTDGDATADTFIAVLAGFSDPVGLGGGVGIVQTGVDASASLGFIEVTLTGTAAFGANVALGLNTGVSSPANDQVLTLAELLQVFDPEASTELLDVVAPPRISFDNPPADAFGGIDVTLDVAAGSADFTAIASTILGGVDTSLSLDLLALGDPFLKTTLEQQGGLLRTGAETFEFNGDFTDVLAPGATLRITPDGGSAIDAKIATVAFSGGTTTVTLEPTTGLDLTAEAADLSGTGIVLLPSVRTDLPDFGPLGAPEFGAFGVAEIVQLLQFLTDFLGQFEQFDFLDTPIPIVDRSVADLVAVGDDLAAFIDEFQQNPSSSLQFLEDAINDAIGFSSAALTDFANAAGAALGNLDDPFDIGLTFDDQGNLVPSDDVWTLTFELTLGAFFSGQLPVGFDLEGVFGDIGLGDLANLAGSANLEISGGVLARLGLGIDLGEFVAGVGSPLANSVYVLEGTGLEAALQIGGQDLFFTAGLGPFALTIQGTDTQDAEVSIDLGVEVETIAGAFTDGRAALSAVLGSLGTHFAIHDGTGIGNDSFGTISGTLPVFAPNDSNLAGTILVGEAVGAGFGDLANIGSAPQLITSDATAPASDKIVIDVHEIVDFVTNFNPAELSLFDQILLAVDAFDELLSLLQTTIFGNIAELSIPLVGPAFADAADFIGNFREDFVGPLQTGIEEIKNAAADFANADKNIISKLLFDLLGPAGLGLLEELATGDKPTLESPGVLSPEDFIALDSDLLQQFVDGDVSLEEALIAWNFMLGDDIVNVPNADIGFNLGIPGLALETEGAVSLNLNWQLALGFGISGASGFFLDVSDPDELEFNFDVTIDGSITGELGFLQLTGTNASRDLDGDETAETTALTAKFGVDIFEAGAIDDDALTLGFTEFGDIDFTFGAAAEAAAVLDLALGLNTDLLGGGILSGFPTVGAGFNFLWQFGDVDAPDGLVTEGFGDALANGLQVVAFTDIGINLGEFLSDVVKPLVDKISEVTGPIQPIIDFLTAPVPVVSELGLNITILDIAAAFGDFDAGLIESLAEVVTLINTLAGLPDGDLLIPLIGDGDSTTANFDDAFVIFNALGSGSTGAISTLSTHTVTGLNPFTNDLTDAANRTSIIGDHSTLFGGIDILGAVLGESGAIADALGGLISNSAGETGDDEVFDFPFINDPVQVFNLLLGEPMTLITADLAPLQVALEWSQFFSIFGPLGVSITLTVEAALDFAFGFDTEGLQQFVETGARNPLLTLNGLYVSDTENADGTGADVPELTLLGGIAAAAEVNLVVARAGVAGGLFIEILFDLFDPDGDGKVRIAEIISNIENQLRAPDGEKALAPLAIFDVMGEIFARLFAFLKVDFGLFEIDKEFNILPPITILEFEIDFFRPPVVASEQDNGDLIVNVGPFAENRLLGNATDIAEIVRIEKLGVNGDTMEVAIWTENDNFGEDSPTSSNPFVYEMKLGRKLIIDGGDKNDDIELIGFNGEEVQFLIDGGAGNDTIVFSGAAVAGGEGEFAGFHRITGGAGSDTITGSLGTDLIIGGAGDDTIDGNDGDDLIFGDASQLLASIARGLVAANDGVDMLSGGDGDDILFGSGGADTISGNDGDDLILADGGAVAFQTGSVKKIRANVLDIWNGAVSGTNSPDVAYADTAHGGTGDDIVFTGAGNDTITGGGDDDILIGGTGGDTISDSGGRNIIFGDTGQLIGDYTGFLPDSGDSFQDQLNDLDAIADLVAPGIASGRDTITGGSDQDLIFAGPGNDTADGGAGADMIFGGAGNDELSGGAQDDRIFGQAGRDTIEGNGGNDRLNGGSGADSVSGNAGDDLLIATQGQDLMLGGIGDDTLKVYYQGGRTTSNIVVDGGAGSDLLQVFGTTAADEILLRANASGGNAFIANINGEFNVERINYDDSVEQIVINGGLGDDFFAVDDTAAVVTINGELGDDRFQIGQLFRTARTVADANIADVQDEFFTIETTRGFLSRGISEVMTINGGLGNDDFTVFHNAAVLQLNGDDGDDTFTVRAFALVGSQEPLRERTDLSGGAGADQVRYAVNAPVNIDGGDGFDTLTVIGTEFGDDFVITEDGVFGAGINVNFVNIETLRVDGAEGDDRFFVKSTSETFLTEIFGGLGDDSFFMSGDTPPVVSNDLRGHSGIIAHEMESTLSGSVFDGQTVHGISANVADDDEPFAVITLTDGSTTIAEGDATGDTYQIVLTRQPTKDVEVVIAAPIPSPDGREQRSYFFRVWSGTATDARADGSTVTLTFTPSNWNTPQIVKVVADDADDGVAPLDPTADDPDRLDTGFNFVRDDVVPEDDQVFDYDDDAFEGTRTGILTHNFKSREIATGTGADLISVVNGFFFDTQVVVSDFTPGGTAFTPDEVIGHRFKITAGPGAVESRFIVAAELISGGTQMELTLDRAYALSDLPVASESSYEIIVDDSVRGLVGDFTEVVAEEVFDDRTFFNIGTAKVSDALVGRTFEIISGPGAGQAALVLTTGIMGYDSNGDPIAGPGWIEVNARFATNPVDGESIYRMRFYDGLASQIVSVTIDDNDTPSIVTDETIGAVAGAPASIVSGSDDITAVIEGGDGDHAGEWDAIDFSLNKMPSDAVLVTVHYDATQLELSDLNGSAVADVSGENSTLTFDIAAADWDDIQTILVKATDDTTREGFHNSLITFSFSSAHIDQQPSRTETFDIDPTVQSASVGLSFKPVSLNPADVILNGTAVSDIPNIDVVFIGNKLIFFDPFSTADGAFDAGRSELVPIGGIVEVTYDYTAPGFDGTFASPILVRIADDDAPTLLVRETGGTTDVIETDASGIATSFANDTYELVLTGAPESGETVKVYVDELITKTTRTGGIRFDEIQVEATSSDTRFGQELVFLNGFLQLRSFVEFTDADWDDPIEITVAAVPDTFVDGGDTKVFAPGPATLSGILGPVVIDGFGGSGSVSGLEEPLMLPGETNVKPAAGDIVDIADGSDTVTVNRSDIDGEILHELRIRVATDDMPSELPLASEDELEALIGKTVEITRAPLAPSARDQFRLIIDVEVSDPNATPLDLTDDLVTFTLNAPYDLDEGETFDLSGVTEAPDGEALVNRFALTSESLNFFVNEEESVDFMFVNDTDSPADSSGTLTASRLYGFNMGPDIVIGGQERQGGITYGRLEVLEINLGTGYNSLDVLGTASRADGFQTWTIINTGTEVDDPNQTGERVGDTVNVLVNDEDVEVAAGTGGLVGQNPDSPTFRTTLEIAGLGFADGALEGHALVLTNIVLGEATVFERTIRTNIGDTLILDAPLPVTEEGDIDLDGDTEWQIVDRRDGGLAINTEGGDDVVNAGMGALVHRSTDFTNQISTREIVVFGGAGDDEITGGLGDDILFGDVGRVDYLNADGAIVTRLGHAPEVITGELASPPVEEGATTLDVVAYDPSLPNESGSILLPVADDSTGGVLDPSETADTGLVGLFVDINDGTGFREPPRLIVSNTTDSFTVADAFTSAFDETTRFRISTVPEDQTDGFTYDPGRILAIADAGGGNDLIFGGGGEDVLIGGEGEDELHGDADADIGIGDLGVIERPIDPSADEPSAFGDVVPTLLDNVRTIALGTGGDDDIFGGDADDMLLGGAGKDTISGGNDVDLILGDNGVFDLTEGVLERFFTTDLDPQVTQTGDDDEIDGDAGEDIILGGVGDDRLMGGEDDDLILGDHGEVRLTDATDAIDDEARYVAVFHFDLDQRTFGGNDVIFGDEDDDVLIGAAGDDLIDGDLGRDLIFGDNVVLDRTAAADFDDFTDPRFRTLDDTGELYGTGSSETFGNGGADGAVLVDGTHQLEPVGEAPSWRNWAIDILDHTEAAVAAGAADVGDDYIAGGGDDDMIFGQLGDDIVQGDGSIDGLDNGGLPAAVGASRDANGVLTVDGSFEAVTDGDDYIEGNGGNDVIFGNLGQDDIIGDNSDLFSLGDAGDAGERAQVGSDILFGGAGLRIDRNEYVENPESVDAILIDPKDRHARDSDMILGDNGRIFRVVAVDDPGTGATSFLSFRYDAVDDNPTEHYAALDPALDRSAASERIVVRAADLLNYTPGGTDVDAAASGDYGAGDEIHGESGDDFIYGMKGDDVLFGDSEDDDIIAGYGDDWVSGGTGQDGVLGGDGRIFTAKNSATTGEPLNGIGTVQVGEVISTPGNKQQSTIHIDNALKKVVDLTPFHVDDSTDLAKITDTSTGDDDIIFGGLGSDFLHGGFGSDAISGAEAMPGEVIFVVGETFGSAAAPLPYSFDNPGNPGDFLNFGAVDPNEFPAYDQDAPRPMVFVDPNNGFVFTDPGALDAVPFVLNHDAQDGALTDVAADGKPTDGNDVIFGDLGEDWLVGGTGRDHLWGGLGSDLLDADDDRSTDGGLNQTADPFASYADIAYGGGGRDVLLGNMADDRLIDWAGEFNSFIVPFSPFGADTVSRTLLPQLPAYLYDLSEADGADPTRDVDGSTARNGEPFGEIGLFVQQDEFWQPQTGGPDDPQPGNKKNKKLKTTGTGSGGETLETADLEATMEEAIRRLALSDGLTDAQIAELEAVELQIADLSGNQLAITDGNTITFDIDGAGFGYFVDDTLTEDEEFAADGSALTGSAAEGQIDLLTVVMHELGHILGFDHTRSDAERDYMTGILDPSQRLGLFDDPEGSSPVLITDAGDEALVLDDRIDALVRPDEARLLDTAYDADLHVALKEGANGKGKSKRVDWVR